jgi:hypothetical protein
MVDSDSGPVIESDANAWSSSTHAAVPSMDPILAQHMPKRVSCGTVSPGLRAPVDYDYHRHYVIFRPRWHHGPMEFKELVVTTYVLMDYETDALILPVVGRTAPIEPGHQARCR